MKRGKWIEKIDWVLAAELAAVCVMVIPILMVSFYALPLRDDFTNADHIRKSLMQHPSYIGAAISQIIYYYQNVSGYFLAFSLNYFISPLLRGGGRFFEGNCIFLQFFFYSSLYFLIYELLEFFHAIRDKKIILFVYILILFAFTNNEYNSEMETWYCVLIGYVAVAACMFWGIIFFLKAMQNDRMKKLNIPKRVKLSYIGMK